MLIYTLPTNNLQQLDLDPIMALETDPRPLTSTLHLYLDLQLYLYRDRIREMLSNCWMMHYL